MTRIKYKILAGFVCSAELLTYILIKVIVFNGSGFDVFDGLIMSIIWGITWNLIIPAAQEKDGPTKSEEIVSENLSNDNETSQIDQSVDINKESGSEIVYEDDFLLDNNNLGLRKIENQFQIKTNNGLEKKKLVKFFKYLGIILILVFAIVAGFDYYNSPSKTIEIVLYKDVDELKYNANEFGYKGRVKSIREIPYQAKKNLGFIVKAYKTENVLLYPFEDLSGHNEFSYDINGNLVEENFYDQSGVLKKDRYRYNSMGNRVEDKFETYDKDGITIDQTTINYAPNHKISKSHNAQHASNRERFISYTYNNFGNIILENHQGTYSRINNEIVKYNYNYEWEYIRNEEGILIEANKFDSAQDRFKHTTYTYDNKGNVIKEIEWSYYGISTRKINTYYDDGQLRESQYYEYNLTSDKIDCISYWIFDKMGNLVYRQRIMEKNNFIEHRSYNENGDLVEVVWEDHEGKRHSLKFGYKYKRLKGNGWVKKIIYEENNPKYIIEREIEYYR